MVKNFFPVFLICCLLVLIPDLSMAQIYRWVDQQGTVHFPDSPPPDG